MIWLIIVLLLLCGATCLLEMIPCIFMPNRKKWVKASVVCNLITNPILNLTLLLLQSFIFTDAWMLCITILLEVVVIGFEAFLYKHLVQEELWKCLLFSFVANVLSFGCGMYIMSLFWNGTPSYHSSLNNPTTVLPYSDLKDTL